MPKASIHFNLPEESQDFHDAVHAVDYKLALWEISQEIFRPARKHGYPDEKIQKLLQTIDECVSTVMENGQGTDLIGLLEEKFYEILREKGIEL